MGAVGFFVFRLHVAPLSEPQRGFIAIDPKYPAGGTPPDLMVYAVSLSDGKTYTGQMTERGGYYINAPFGEYHIFVYLSKAGIVTYQAADMVWGGDCGNGCFSYKLRPITISSENQIEFSWPNIEAPKEISNTWPRP